MLLFPGLGRALLHLVHDELVEYPLVHSVSKSGTLVRVVVCVDELYYESLAKDGWQLTVKKLHTFCSTDYTL